MRKFTLLFLMCVTSCVFAQYDTVTIQEIQQVSSVELGNCSDTSSRLGDTVVTEGVVVVDGSESSFSPTNGGFLSSGQTWIQDSTGAFSGIDVFGIDNTNAVVENLAAGDSVRITGVIDRFEGETELIPLDDSYGQTVEVLDFGKKVKQNSTTVGDLNDNNRENRLQTGEQWEGAFVKLQGPLTVTNVNNFSGGGCSDRVSFNVEDASGNLINVSDRFMAQRTPTCGGDFVAPNVGDRLDSLKGIIIHSENGCTGGTGRGYEINPFDSSHYAWGETAPFITNVNHTPLVPNNTQSVSVSAKITDADGSISSATLYWKTGSSVGGAFNSKTMTDPDNDDIYHDTIPSKSYGTFVQYYIEATDDSGNTTVNPVGADTNSTHFYTVRDTLTIYDVQFTPFSNGNSGYVNEEVTVTGVVSASMESGNLGYVYLQEKARLSWGGLWVSGSNTLSNLKVGDKVSVKGTIREDFGLTRMQSVASVTVLGSDSAEPVTLNPTTFTNYDFATNEAYEGMLVDLVNPTAGDKIHVVDTRPDSPNDYGEYRIGSDNFNPSDGSRVLAGRQASGAASSLNVSYVSDSVWQSQDGTMNVSPVVVADSMKLDTLRGVMTYTYGNFKILPRNNADFIGMTCPIVINGSVDNSNNSIDVTTDYTTGTVSYSWTGPNGFTDNTEDISGLSTSGAYVLNVSDDLCSKNDTFMYCSIDISGTVNNDTANGSIDITVNDTAGETSFSWTGPNGFTDSTEDITGLDTSGTYTVTVTDSACSKTKSFNYTTCTIDLSGNVDENNGSIDVTVSDTVGSVKYNWTGPDAG
ncbi:MAG: hypothetical protein ABEH43_10665, partial [Flavobacteriales bacterium]